MLTRQDLRRIARTRLQDAKVLLAAGQYDGQWVEGHGVVRSVEKTEDGVIQFKLSDRDGTFFRLIAGGLRNPLGIAFNEVEEMFTYDADMERDLGAPWYLPTRVLHLVPGGD